MRSSRSTASTPTLMDSTMFSLNSFRRSYCAALRLQRVVEARVLHRDADVAGQRFQQLHVFAGEEVAFRSLAQPQHRDHAVHHGAGNVVVQVELADGFARFGRLAHRVCGVVEEQVAGRPLRALHVQEVEVKVAGVRDAVRLGQRELLRPLRVRQEDRPAGPPSACAKAGR